MLVILFNSTFNLWRCFRKYLDEPFCGNTHQNIFTALHAPPFSHEIIYVSDHRIKGINKSFIENLFIYVSALTALFAFNCVFTVTPPDYSAQFLISRVPYFSAIRFAAFPQITFPEKGLLAVE